MPTKKPAKKIVSRSKDLEYLNKNLAPKLSDILNKLATKDGYFN